MGRARPPFALLANSRSLVGVSGEAGRGGLGPWRFWPTRNSILCERTQKLRSPLRRAFSSLERQKCVYMAQGAAFVKAAPLLSQSCFGGILLIRVQRHLLCINAGHPGNCTAFNGAILSPT